MFRKTKNNLLFRVWQAVDPKAVVLLVHGLGAHSARWEYTADFLTKNGYACYAPELRGFGETSERPRGHIDSFNIYYNDLAELTALAQAENSRRKIFLLGESLGGLIAFLAAAKDPGKYAGLIMISPAFKNGMKFSALEYLNAFIVMIFDPKKAIKMPFTSAQCTRDEDYQRKMNADDRELRVASARVLWNTLTAQLSAQSRLKRSNLPALFLVAGQDYLVDPAASRQAFKKLAAEDKTIIEYPKMHHALSIELGREKVFNDILLWLEKRI